MLSDKAQLALLDIRHNILAPLLDVVVAEIEAFDSKS